MTQDKKNSIELTQEEQDKLALEHPLLLEAITKGSVVAPGWLATWRRKQQNISEVSQEQANDIQKKVISSQKTEQGILAQWCGFPTDLTRCSPFFPINLKELKHRAYLENYIITTGNWGKITYTGPKLSIYDEDILIALLAILEQKSIYIRESYLYNISTYEGDNGILTDKQEIYSNDMLNGLGKTLTYKGPILPILHLIGINRPGKSNYERVLSALERMSVAGVKLSISTGKTKTGKSRPPRITQMTTMLSGVYWDDEIKELTVTINPFFYETYLSGRITLIDMTKRLNIKGVISKALYRFIQSQKDGTFSGHFLTLADALNMDREQPAKKIRQLLKTAINELIRQKIVRKKSGFLDNDIIRLERTPEALPPREKEIAKNRC